MNQGTFNGWAIDIWQDVEDDNIKLMHDAYPPGSWERDEHGRIIRIPGADMSKMLDLSPYGTDDLDLCALSIALGCPSRKQFNLCGPVYREDLEKLWRERHGDKPLPKAEPIN